MHMHVLCHAGHLKKCRGSAIFWVGHVPPVSPLVPTPMIKSIYLNFYFQCVKLVVA